MIPMLFDQESTEKRREIITSPSPLGEYLGKGWKVQAVLPSGRIVVDNEDLIHHSA